MPDIDVIDPQPVTSDPVLLAPYYVLGEHRRKAADIDGLSAFLEASQMIDDLALWGLDSFHSSDQTAASLGIESARETLREYQRAPDLRDAARGRYRCARGPCKTLSRRPRARP